MRGGKDGGARRVAPRAGRDAGGLPLDRPGARAPAVRSHVETQLDLIARGEASHADVVAQRGAVRPKFQNFVAKIRRMDDLFESKFDLRERDEGTRAFSKCGQCGRYLSLVAARRGAPRLYRAAQETTLRLPSAATSSSGTAARATCAGSSPCTAPATARFCARTAQPPGSALARGRHPRHPRHLDELPAAVACPHPPGTPSSRAAPSSRARVPAATRAALALEPVQAPGRGSTGAWGARGARSSPNSLALIRRVAVAEASPRRVRARCLEGVRGRSAPLADGGDQARACAAWATTSSTRTSPVARESERGLMRGERGGRGEEEGGERTGRGAGGRTASKRDRRSF